MDYQPSTSQTAKKRITSADVIRAAASQMQGGSASGSNSGNGRDIKPGYFFQTPQWKRFSVYISIALSIASLVTGAIAQLARISAEQQRALAVTGIVVNAVSVALSALTSLDWSSEMVRDKEFLDRLLGFVHVHGDGKISLVDVPKDADMRT